MKKKYACIFLICMCSLFSMSYGQQIVNIGIGPTWPKFLRETEKPTGWNASIEYNRVFDNIVGFGIDAELMWNIIVDDTSYLSPDSTPIFVEEHEKKHFMFPILFALFFDPIPKYIVHPVVRGEFGINMLVKSDREYDSTGKEIVKPDELDRSGFYIGIIGKASVDAVYDLGKHAALYAGFEFQWGSKAKKRIKGKDNQYFKEEIYGPAIRMGVSFLF